MATESITRFPDEIEEAQIICALRFDGYKYEDTLVCDANDKPVISLPQLAKPLVKTLSLHESDNDNFAAFFALQRFLFKWGGEYLTKYSDEHIAFDFLFLNLYRLDVPEQFAHKEYVSKWNRDFKPAAEKTAAYIRNSFRRQGTGEKIATI